MELGNDKGNHPVLKWIQYQFFPFQTFPGLNLSADYNLTPLGGMEDILLNENASLPEIFTFYGSEQANQKLIPPSLIL